MAPLTLGEIYVGKTDAKNELLYDNEQERQRFIDGFHSPPNLRPEHFLKGDRYFVTGMKGTGKTALLRYLAIRAERERGISTSFVLFKAEFTESDKKQFAQAARATAVKNDIERVVPADYQAVWRWFIYRHIVRVAEEKKLSIAKKDANWKKFAACVTAPIVEGEESGISRIIPRLKRGHVEIGFDPKLGIEFEWDDKSKTTVAFGKLAKQADELFSRLQLGEDTLYVFIDELELSIGSAEQHRRDASIIGDLLLSIDRINRTAKQRSIGVLVFAAVRSEVLGAVGAIGKEVNKVIADFGSRITWDLAGSQVGRHPLLQIVVQRLRISQPDRPLSSRVSDDELWASYFPAEIQGDLSQKYLLHQTWYRPRDIVRLLNIASDQFPDHTSFSEEVLRAIRRRYSIESWAELAEELGASYRNAEIDSIKQVLTRITSRFSFEQFKTRMKEVSSVYSEVEKLANGHSPLSILSDLYKVGAVGNAIPKGGGKTHYRYAFRGDDDPYFDDQFCVHPGLRPVFSVD